MELIYLLYFYISIIMESLYISRVSMKKKISLLLALLMLVTLMPSALAESKTVNAVKNTKAITLDGENVMVGSYIVEGFNYLKLRDLAAIMNGKKSQFSVSYDNAKRLISVDLGKAYEKVEGDLVEITSNKAKAKLEVKKILVNGQEKEIRTALINDNNYLQLRDLGELAGFGVGYDAKSQTIILKSDGAVEEKTEEKKEETKAPVDDTKKNSELTDEQKAVYALIPLTETSIKKYANKPAQIDSVLSAFYMFINNEQYDFAADVLKGLDLNVSADEAKTFMARLDKQAAALGVNLKRGYKNMTDLKRRPVTEMIAYEDAVVALIYLPEKGNIIGVVEKFK